LALNFPSSPVDGQIYIDSTSGSRYVYVAASSKWKSMQYAATVVSFGYQTANAGYDTANAAFNMANAAYSIQNVDFTLSNSAFTHANAAYVTANAALPNVSNAVFAGNLRVTGNLLIGMNTVTITDNHIISAEYYRMNTSNHMVVVPDANRVNTIFNIINVSFDTANSAYTSANNVGPQIAPTYNTANAAFDKANNALANTSGTYFNGDLFFPSGNVAIGETTANARLLVTSSSNRVAIRGIADQAGGVAGHSIGAVGGSFSSVSFNAIQAQAAGAGYGAFITSSSGYGAYIASITGSPLVVGKYAGSDYLTVTTSGNTGFGTSAPAYRVDIAGAANISNPTLLVAGQNVISTLVTSYDTANAAYANANTKLANATGTFAGSLTTTGTVTSNGYVYVTALDAGNEGGEIQLSGAGNYAGWALDVYQNNHRTYVRTGSTLANLTFFHALGGSVRMGVNKADPLYTLDVNGDIACSGLTVTGNSTEAPPSEVAFFARNSAPTGWLKCNGAAISRSTYANLFAAIGTTFGSGDGSTTFNVPDMRGYFPRAWVDDGSVGGARTFGTTQTDAFQGHWHQYTGTTTDNTGGIGGIIDGPNTQTGGGGNLILGPISDGSNGTPRTASETRPSNIALLACIKF